MEGLQVIDFNMFPWETNATSPAVADFLGEKQDAVGTGSKDLKDLNVFHEREGKRVLTCWPSATANKVEGTDGQQFYPGVTKKDDLLVWVKQAQRSLITRYEDDVTVHGVKLLRYTPDPSELGTNPDYNQGAPAGVVNMTACSGGLPLYLSQPHWLNADPAFTLSIDGFAPDYESHQSFIDVEPNVGASFRAFLRLQVNLGIQAIPGVFPNILRNLLPILWVEEHAEITEKSAQDFKDAVYKAYSEKKGVAIAGFVLGPLFVIVGIIIAAVVFRRGRQNMVQRIDE